jgi:hypothetical protein
MLLDFSPYFFLLITTFICWSGPISYGLVVRPSPFLAGLF